jgi:tight adherence protein C
MSTNILLFGASGFMLLMLIPAFWLSRQMRWQDRFAARILLVHGTPPETQGAPGGAALRTAALNLASAVGQAILRSGIVPVRTLSELEQTLTTSGLRGSQGIGVFIGAKLLGAVGLPIVTWLVVRDLPVPPLLTTILPLCSALVGLMAPDWVIARRRKRHLQRLEHGLPDTLDMLVICAQAGLGLGPAIVRVAAELRVAYPEIAMELEKTATELQLLSDSRVAITNLGARTGLEPLKRLGATLVQSLQYGTPLSDALRVLAAEIRGQMLNRFEARAARLPVMMTLPTILFILPCVFLIAGGPAIIQLMRAFSH